MTHATIAANIHETLDIELYLRAQVTLYLVFSADNLTYLRCLLISPVFYLDTPVHTGLIKDLLRATTTYTIDISQRDLTPLVLGPSIVITLFVMI